MAGTGGFVEAGPRPGVCWVQRRKSVLGTTATGQKQRASVERRLDKGWQVQLL